MSVRLLGYVMLLAPVNSMKYINTDRSQYSVSLSFLSLQSKKMIRV